MNPVRAAMVASPADYRRSSYRANAFGQFDDVITEHALYVRLGKYAEARQYCYRELFRRPLDPYDAMKRAQNVKLFVGKAEEIITSRLSRRRRR